MICWLKGRGHLQEELYSNVRLCIHRRFSVAGKNSFGVFEDPSEDVGFYFSIISGPRSKKKCSLHVMLNSAGVLSRLDQDVSCPFPDSSKFLRGEGPVQEKIISGIAAIITVHADVVMKQVKPLATHYDPGSDSRLHL